MKERIVELRKKLNMTQKEFAQSIGIAQSSWAMIESGGRNINERHIKLISSIYHANEKWLKTGEGEMFTIDPEEDETAVYIEELIDGTDDSVKSLIKSILKAYCKMTPKSKAVFNKLVDDCLEDMEKGKD